MPVARFLVRASKTALPQCRNYFLSSSPSPINQQHFYLSSVRCNLFHSLPDIPINKASPLHNGLCSNVVFPHCGMSTFASPDKEHGEPAEKNGDNGSAEATKQADEGSTMDTESSEQSQGQGSEGDMDDLSREDLVKLMLEKEEALVKQQEEYKELKDTYLRSYAEMENCMERTRREAENLKKFAVQSFAKSFLDVADNLGRAASVTKESYNKIDASEDTVGAMPLLKSLLDGVEMTEKQLADVLRKAGIEKFDPSNEQFDPNRHNAVFQVTDNSKPPGTVAVVLKAGYTLHDRIIRPAEVGVTIAVENNEANT